MTLKQPVPETVTNQLNDHNVDQPEVKIMQEKSRCHPMPIELGNGMQGKLVAINTKNLRQLTRSLFKESITTDGLADDNGNTYGLTDILNRRLLILNGKFKATLVLYHCVRNKKILGRMLQDEMYRLLGCVLLIGYQQHLYDPTSRYGALLLQAIKQNVPPSACLLVYPSHVDCGIAQDSFQFKMKDGRLAMLSHLDDPALTNIAKIVLAPGNEDAFLPIMENNFNHVSVISTTIGRSHRKVFLVFNPNENTCWISENIHRESLEYTFREAQSVVYKNKLYHLKAWYPTSGKRKSSAANHKTACTAKEYVLNQTPLGTIWLSAIQKNREPEIAVLIDF